MILIKSFQSPDKHFDGLLCEKQLEKLKCTPFLAFIVPLNLITSQKILSDKFDYASEQKSSLSEADSKKTRAEYKMGSRSIANVTVTGQASDEHYK